MIHLVYRKINIKKITYQCVQISEGRLKKQLSHIFFQWCPMLGQEIVGAHWYTKGSV